MQIADLNTTSTWTDPRFWENVRRDAASAFGMSPAVYADEDFFAAEQRRLFGRAWVGVAPAWELARPGRLLVRSVGDGVRMPARGLSARVGPAPPGCPRASHS